MYFRDSENKLKILKTDGETEDARFDTLNIMK